MQIVFETMECRDIRLDVSASYLQAFVVFVGCHVCHKPSHNLTGLACIFFSFISLHT